MDTDIKDTGKGAMRMEAEMSRPIYQSRAAKDCRQHQKQGGGHRAQGTGHRLPQSLPRHQCEAPCFCTSGLQSSEGINSCYSLSPSVWSLAWQPWDRSGPLVCPDTDGHLQLVLYPMGHSPPHWAKRGKEVPWLGSQPPQRPAPRPETCTLPYSGFEPSRAPPPSSSL